MNKRFVCVISALGSLTTFGCGGPLEQPVDEEFADIVDAEGAMFPEPIERELEAMALAAAEPVDEKGTDKVAADFFHVANGLNGTVVIANANTYMCSLSSIGGPLKTVGNYSPSLGVGRQGNNITMSGDPGPPGDNHIVHGGAYCVARASFTAPNNFLAYQEEYEYNFLWDTAGGLSANSLWGNDHAAAVTSIGYDYGGLGDQTYVVPSTTAGAKNQFHIFQNAAGTKRGKMWLSSYRLRSSGNVKFTGPGGSGTATVAGEYEAYAPGTNVTPTPVVDVVMQPKSTHFCYMTLIGGKFDSGYTWVKAFPENDGNWHLKATTAAGAGTDGVFARARCVKRNQN
jgi:hypothetical protein